MDEIIKKDLINYVTDQYTDEESIKRIKLFCQQQTPQSLVLYRGHKKSREIRFNDFWYSASFSKKVAKEEFSSGYCCVFKINLVEVPVIDINKFIGDDIGKYKDEQEYIFLGGGSFYKDNTYNEKGFLDKGNGEFECWYKIDVNKKYDINQTFDIDQILERIPEEEYDFINDPSDIIGLNLTENQQMLVYNKIQQIKDQQNGGKKNTKSKKNIKKQIRKTRKNSNDNGKLFIKKLLREIKKIDNNYIIEINNDRLKYYRDYFISYNKPNYNCHIHLILNNYKKCELNKYYFGYVYKYYDLHSDFYKISIKNDIKKLAKKITTDFTKFILHNL